MVHNYYRFLLLILFAWVLPGYSLLAQNNMPGPVAVPEQDKSIQFIETRNRVGHGVQYEAAVQGGKLFLHPDKFTYSFIDRGSDAHNHSTEPAKGKKGPTEEEKKPKGHAYSVTFLGADKAVLKPSGAGKNHYSYFLGNDESKWVSGAKGYRQIDYDNLYPGIDMRLHEQNGKLKYEFFLEKGTDPSVIKMKYEGAEKLELKNGELVVTTIVNTVTEGRPYTYQVVNGAQQPVACNFKLTGTEVTFDFPEGYDISLPLVIDPVLTYSTYSGSTEDNWGFTAAFDTLGNIYSGGVIFAAGFPTTLGPFYDLTFNGGMADICILKYNPNASGPASLEYVTYIGGSGTEAPHSLVVNNQNELLILGTTGSVDYPIQGGFDTSFGGGPSITPLSFGVGVSHPGGSDIIISKLNPTGTILMASTFLGGTGNDGLLSITNPLTKNYGDQFRGDIIVDASDNVYIASSTSSPLNFPIVNGFQSVYGGGETDGVVCKINSDLSVLLWSSYLGGADADAAFSIQLDQNQNVFVCGGTRSSDFPASANAHKPAYGNNGDGFIVRINNNGTALQRATFIGPSSYDQTYFVQIDNSNNVYVLGQTQGTYPVTGGTYSVPNSKQFIHALDNDLISTVFSTTFGSANGQINISPTAFLVNECDRMYVAGWGGNINASFPGSNNYVGGLTTGMPLTPDATQPTTDGSDFYLMQLSQYATALDFATYIGSSTVPEHVDGGTSRFDKRGNIYHAVCGCGGGASQFPTTPNAWSQTNNSTNCNNAAFKYAIPELSADFIPSVIPLGPRETEACDPATFYFRRVHSGGVSYLWDFGDNTTSTDPGPLSHTYPGPGSYIVTLTITDSSTCVITDTAVDTVHVLETTGSVNQDQIMCQPYAVQLEATGGSTYTWSPATGLSDPFVADPIATPDTTTTFSVDIGNTSGCIRTLTVEVVVIEEPVITNFDSTGICPGQSTQLSATPGLGYVWSPNYALSSTTVANPIASPDSSVTYTVQVDAGLGCVYTKYIEVKIDELPQIQMPSDTSICHDAVVPLTVTGSPLYSYQWSPATWLDSDTIASPVATPDSTITYFLQAHSGNCGITDSVTITVAPVSEIITNSPVTTCIGTPVQLLAGPVGGFSFSWSPDSTLNNGSVSNPIANPSASTWYFLTATGFNCTYTDSVEVIVNPFPQIQMPADTFVCFGGSVMLNVQGAPGYEYLWSPATGLNDTTIANPVANPNTNTVYYVQVGLAGCQITDSVEVTAVPPAGIVTPGPLAICLGDSIPIEAAGNIGFDFIWTPNTGLSDNTEPFVWASPTESTIYTLTATGFGCTYINTIEVGVGQYPQIQMPEDTSVCSGTSTELLINGNPQYNYLWMPSAGLTDTTIFNPVATPASTTLYTVYISNGNCVLRDSVTVEVRQVPVAEAGPNSEVCPETPVRLSASPANPDYTYTWWPAEGLSTTNGPETEAAPSASITYYLAVTGSNNCSFTDSVIVTVHQAPELSATPENPEGIAPYPLSFTNLSTGAGNYNWNFGNGTTSTELNPSVIYSVEGTYAVVLSGTFGPNCPIEDTVALVRVRPPFVPNIITPNSDGYNDTFVPVLTNEPLRLEIYNRWGKLLYENSDYQSDWGGDGLPEGIYYYQLSTPSGRNWKGWLEIMR